MLPDGVFPDVVDKYAEVGDYFTVYAQLNQFFLENIKNAYPTRKELHRACRKQLTMDVVFMSPEMLYSQYERRHDEAKGTDWRGRQ